MNVFKRENYPYIKQQPGIIRILLECLESYSDPQSHILSLAAGQGYVEAMVEDKLGRSVTCVDLNHSALKKAETARRVCGDIYTLPLKRDSVDFLIAVDIIEHLTEPDRMIKSVSNVLKSGGYFFIKSPNWAHWHYRWWFLKQGSLKTFHQLNQGHFVFYSFNEMKALLTQASFKVVRHFTFCYTPEWIARMNPNLFSASTLMLCQKG